MAMQIFALPNLIGRWQTAPIWDRFEETILEIEFKDAAHFEASVIVDNSDFNEGVRTTMSIRGIYQLKDSLCTFITDTTTFSAIPEVLPGWDFSVDKASFLIMPSSQSVDRIAFIEEKNHVFVFYRK